MKDVKGYPVKDGDLVVAKGLGQTYVGVDIGVVVGNQIRTLESTHPMYGCYLIRNPDEQELAIKNEIMAQIQRNKDEAEQKRQLLKQQKAKVVGTVYTTSKGKFIYCGKMHVKVAYDDLTSPNKSEVMFEGTGHYYFPAKYYKPGMTFDELIAERITKEKYGASSRWVADYYGYVLKNATGFLSIDGSIDVPSSINIEHKYHDDSAGYGYWYSPADYKYTITAEDI